jgi:hypothetical protein
MTAAKNILVWLASYSVAACGKNEGKVLTVDPMKDSTSNVLSKLVQMKLDDHSDALSSSIAENLFTLTYNDGANGLDPAAGRTSFYVTKDGVSRECEISFVVDVNKNGLFEKGDSLAVKNPIASKFGQSDIGKPFEVWVSQRQADGRNLQVWSGEWSAK